MSSATSVASSVASSISRSVAGVGGVAVGWTPSDAANLVHWLDASNAASISATGGAVDSWTSLAGTNLVLAATTTARPTTGATTINGNNVIDFNGTTNTIGSAAGTPVLSQPNTMFAVIKPSNTGAHQWINSRSGSRELIYNNGGAWTAFAELGNLAGASYAAALTFIGCYFADSNSVLYVNDNSYTGSPGSAVLNGLRLGSNSAGSGNWAQGSICEVLIYNSDARPALSSVKSYFNTKWGTALTP